MLPVDVSGSQLLFGIMLHMIYETTHIGHIDHAQYLQMTICKQLHGDLMPGWLTWFVSRFFFLMGFHHQRYKHNRFFGLDPPSTVHTHICLWKHEITSTYVRIFTDVINKHIWVYKTYPVLTFIFWYTTKIHMVFLFPTPTPSWVFALFLRFLRGGHFAGSARLSYHHRHRHQEATSHNFTFVKLFDDGLPSTYPPVI